MISFRYLACVVAFFLLLGNRNGDVAAIFHFMTESFKPRFESGHAHGRRPHIHAAPRLAEIEGNADDANLARDSDCARRTGRHRMEPVMSH